MKKESLKKGALKALKITGITFAICSFFAAMPYCQGILAPKTAGVVTDSISASRTIETNASNVIINFECNGMEFANCLSLFLKANKNLELRKIDDIPSEGLSAAKGFNVMFLRKN